MSKISQFKILDLFCGAGGFSFGMHRNPHFTTVVAVDFNSKAANTFKKNMPQTDVICGDLKDDKTKKSIIDRAKELKVNMIIGGPPCQGFSMKGKKQGLDDPRNFLFLEYLKIVEELQPEVFVIENVKALISTADGWFKDQILEKIEGLGYSVDYGILNAKDFGVPQSRERAIFICSKSKNPFLPFGKGDGVVTTVRDAISDLWYLNSGEGYFESEYLYEPKSEYQRRMRLGCTKLYNHKASNHKDIALEKMKLIPPECGKEYLPDNMKGNQKFDTTWGRLRWSDVSPTIDTRFDTPSNGTNTHPELHRAITPREAARLQSFTDAFIFYGDKREICRQIGNAVPPLLAEAIADSIWSLYEDDEFEKFISESNTYEDSLDEDFKKEHGIFYTDLQLSDSIVKFLRVPRTATAIDPCCGTGSFLHMLKKIGVRNVVGCDFDGKTVETCKKLTGIEEVFNIDTLGNTGEDILQKIGKDKFDYVIGNPPYAPIGKNVSLHASADFQRLVRNSGYNLFIAAMYRAFELAKSDGYISFVIPKNLLHISSYEPIRKFILKEKSIVSIIELGIHFKAVRGEQIVLTLRNQFCPNNKIKFYTYSQGKITFMSEVPQDYYDNEIIVFTSNQEIPIYNRLRSKAYSRLEELCAERIRRGHSKSSDAIRGKMIRKMGFRDIDLPKDGTQIFLQNIFSAEAGLTASYAGNLVCGETVTILKLDDIRTTKFVLGLLNSRLCNYYLIRFLFNNSRLTIHTDAKYLNEIPVVPYTLFFNELVSIVEEMEEAEYMGNRWFELNERLNTVVYNIYGMTQDERAYVEVEMRKISSQKWYGSSNEVE